MLLLVVLNAYGQQSDFNHISFDKADSIALSYTNEKLNNLPELAYKLTYNLSTDVEKFRAIYKWVCLNIANDYNLYYRNKRKRYRFRDDSLKLKSWNNTFKKRLFKKLLKDKKTICTGYAYLIRELSKLANLECKIVHGYGRTSTITLDENEDANHSWNAIKLNNKWYLCDPTWSSGTPNFETGAFVFSYNDGYFLANPELFIINHLPLDQKWTLIDDTVTFKTFLEHPILYGNAYVFLNSIISPKTMHHEILIDETIHFKFLLNDKIKIDDVTLLIDSGLNDRKLKPKDLFLETNLLTIKHPFSTRGFFDVHLYLNDQLICTYTVEVKKKKFN